MKTKAKKQKPSQQGVLLEMLKSGKKLNPLTAFRATGTMRLSGRIFDFKKLGYRFITTTKVAVNRYGFSVSYAEYQLDLKKTPKKLLK